MTLQPNLVAILRILPQLLIFMFAASNAQTNLPATNTNKAWAKSKPADPNYYVGIGSSSIKSKDFQQTAKKSALEDLLSEIKVMVSSTSILQQIDKDKQFKEQYETNIKTSVADEIQNFELVDTYEDGVNYWVYYRLSRKLYDQQKQSNVERSQKLALQFFDKGVAAEQSQSIATAIDFYLRTLLSIKNLWGEATEINYQGKTIYLGIESYTRLQQLLDQVSIRATSSIVSLYKGSNTPFSFQILNSGKPISKIPVAISPVQLHVQPSIYFTDEQGRSNAQLPDSWINENLKEIELRVDLKSFAQGMEQDKFYEFLIGSLRSPKQKLPVDLKNSTASATRPDLFPFNEDYLDVDLSNSNKYTFSNLRLVPVRSRPNFKTSVGNLGYVMSLHEALESNRVSITETDLDGTVNTLILRNLSNDTLYIMSGEILQGGKQDRVVKNDMLIPPHSGRVKLPVYCVEHGRWSTKDDDGDGDHDPKKGKFGEYYSMANKHLSNAIHNKGQHGVWDEVSKINDKNGVDSDTHAYTGHAHRVEFRDKQEGYATTFKNIFNDQSDVIGMIAVSGNSAIGADLFLSHALFLNAYAKLLYSYSDEAITFGSPVHGDVTAIVRAYSKQLLSVELQQKFMEEKGQVFKRGTQVIHISSL